MWAPSPPLHPSLSPRQSEQGRRAPRGCGEWRGGRKQKPNPYSATKKNKIMLFAATRMDLEIVILSEISHT